MKTKFTPLVLLCKNKVDEAERMLQQNAAEINAKQAEIDSAVREFAAWSLNEPTSGLYQEHLTFSYHKDEYRSLIDRKVMELAQLKQQRVELQEYFRVQNMEYEKAKYLEGLEIKKNLDRLKRKESIDMDEISVMLHNAK
ncbi:MULTISPECIES: flagellar export protein FliJ [Helicobacter]|uniref:Flagellar export protein FliJ n=1 Tax=Helicobacter ibis TaxID=2962633 RepID=A0ABT4VF26_9HELI|nr:MULTISPECIES: flagellar export protein FliJ [Helicobacter]MDA3967073.1 flagellar export protein FliJ [Helicobacter sp. WB40]MDA3969207.1 flagellar export protein FliJ [Helicobacter ibis]